MSSETGIVIVMSSVTIEDKLAVSNYKFTICCKADTFHIKVKGGWRDISLIDIKYMGSDIISSETIQFLDGSR